MEQYLEKKIGDYKEVMVLVKNSVKKVKWGIVGDEFFFLSLAH